MASRMLYKKLADELNKSRAQAKAMEVLWAVPAHFLATNSVADALEKENPRFDRKRFMKECGYDEYIRRLESIGEEIPN